MHQPPIQLDEGEIRLALSDPETHAFTLLTIAMWAFGDAVLGDWEAGVEPMDPAELWAGLHDRFGVWISEGGENKLNALFMALQGDLFYRDVEVFQAVCGSLLDGDLGDLIELEFADLTVPEIMWGIAEVEIARQEPGGPEFSLGVQKYIEDALAIEDENLDAAEEEIKDEYLEMMRGRRKRGVPNSALRLLDEEMADTLEFLDAAESAENPTETVS
jgi:hypothetical protein